jgi:hypothetical protein
MNMMVSAAAMSAASVAAASNDPIFEAIDAHKAAREIVYAAVDAVSIAERELTSKGLRPSRERGNCPSLDEREAKLSEAFEAETEAACALVSIQPATLAGVFALLSYAHSADTDGEGWPTDLQTDDGGKTRSRSWHYFLIQNLAEILPGLVQA